MHLKSAGAKCENRIIIIRIMGISISFSRATIEKIDINILKMQFFHELTDVLHYLFQFHAALLFHEMVDRLSMAGTCRPNNPNPRTLPKVYRTIKYCMNKKYLDKLKEITLK